MPSPIYNAGTDGRVKTSGVTEAASPGDFPTRTGPGVVVATVTKWSRSSSGGGDRPSTVTLESTQNSKGVIDETHLRRGGVRKTTFKVECLVDITVGSPTPNQFESITEGFVDFIVDKSSTLGHYGCLGTITDVELQGAAVDGRPMFSFTFRLNGTLPALAAG